MKGIYEILIVSSTEFEVKKILQKLDFQFETNNGLKSYLFQKLKVDVLISGIGIPMTIYKLTKTLSDKKYDFVINAGICGSFNRNIPVGTPVNVVVDEFADIGITETDNQFKSLFDEKFMSENEFPFVNGKLFNNFDLVDIDLLKVKGITVNTTSGNQGQIKMRQEKFKPDVESMEGAAVAYVCLSEGIDFIQIRSVSNPIEPRNKEHWNIPLAIDKLNEAVINILQNIK